jgi:hypothetical protein
VRLAASVLICGFAASSCIAVSQLSLRVWLRSFSGEWGVVCFCSTAAFQLLSRLPGRRLLPDCGLAASSHLVLSQLSSRLRRRSSVLACGFTTSSFDAASPFLGRVLLRSFLRDGGSVLVALQLLSRLPGRNFLPECDVAASFKIAASLLHPRPWLRSVPRECHIAISSPVAVSRLPSRVPLPTSLRDCGLAASQAVATSQRPWRGWLRDVAFPFCIAPSQTFSRRRLRSFLPDCYSTSVAVAASQRHLRFGTVAPWRLSEILQLGLENHSLSCVTESGMRSCAGHGLSQNVGKYLVRQPLSEVRACCNSSIRLRTYVSPDTRLQNCLAAILSRHSPEVVVSASGRILKY